MSLPQTDAVGGNCSAGNVVRVTFAHSRRNSRSLDQQLSTDFANFCRKFLSIAFCFDHSPALDAVAGL
jgi:hypothetical protein